MAELVELGMEGFNKVTDKFFERGYDKARKVRKGKDYEKYYGKDDSQGTMSRDQRHASQRPRQSDSGSESDSEDSYDDRRDRRQQQGRRTDEHDYDRRAAYGKQQGTQQQAYAERPSSKGYAAADSKRDSLQPYSRQGRDTDPRNGRSANRNRSKSRSRKGRSQSRPSGQGEGIEERIRESFDPSTEGIGAGIAGALIGVFAGHELGDRRKRAMLAGAVVGALGANFAENAYMNSKDKAHKEEKGRDSNRHGEGGQRANGGGGGGGQRPSGGGGGGGGQRRRSP